MVNRVVAVWEGKLIFVCGDDVVSPFLVVYLGLGLGLK